MDQNTALLKISGETYFPFTFMPPWWYNIINFCNSFSIPSACEEAKKLYQLRKVALEAKQNQPDLSNNYTKIKVTLTLRDA